MGKGAGSGAGALVLDSQEFKGPSTSTSRIVKIPIVVPPKGLENVGNTCYANAALQCLLSTSLSHALLEPDMLTIFRRYASNSNLLAMGSGSVDSQEGDEARQIERLSRREQRRKRRETKKYKEKSEWLARQLTQISREYVFPDADNKSWFFGPASTIVNPGSITKHPDRLSKCLRPYMQEDAHEFMRALLSTLTMNGLNKKLSSLFDGLLESAVTCQICNSSSLTRDRYMDLSLNISINEVKSLADALTEFTKTEILDEDNMVMCTCCRKKQPVSKGLRLATAPSILVCHLKRFAFDNYGRMIRLPKHVSFPLKLEIGDYMSKVNKAKPPPYELMGVLVHQGRSCDSGHYLSYVKRQNNWYRVNDHLVTKVSIDVVLSQQAYILIYQVVGMHHSSIQRFTKQNRQSWRHEDISEAAPHFEGSRVPDSNFSKYSLFNLLCTVSEANEAILRDFCCGSISSSNSRNTRNTSQESQRITDLSSEFDATYAMEQEAYSAYRNGHMECDDTIGGSTLGDQSTVYTTDSSQISVFRRANSGCNVREFENEVSRLYSESRVRTHSFVQSDPGGKNMDDDKTPKHLNRNHIPSSSVVLPPRHRKGRHRRHSSTPRKFATR
jgi:Ubiquitin carboxyl-terminal hydrolase